MATQGRWHGVVVGVHAVVLGAAGDVAVGRDREPHKVALVAVPCDARIPRQGLTYCGVIPVHKRPNAKGRDTAHHN